jgi:hypothetical protein
MNLGIDMKLRTDAIGHFDIPTELNIRDAMADSEENDLVKLMSDEEHFLSVWIGQQSVGHQLILKSGPWKQECTEKLSSEIVINLMVEYLHDNMSSLKELQWTRPFDQIFLDNIMKLKNSGA